MSAKSTVFALFSVFVFSDHSIQVISSLSSPIIQENPVRTHWSSVEYNELLQPQKVARLYIVCNNHFFENQYYYLTLFLQYLISLPFRIQPTFLFFAVISLYIRGRMPALYKLSGLKYKCTFFCIVYVYIQHFEARHEHIMSIQYSPMNIRGNIAVHIIKHSQI